MTEQQTVEISIEQQIKDLQSMLSFGMFGRFDSKECSEARNKLQELRKQKSA